MNNIPVAFLSLLSGALIWGSGYYCGTQATEEEYQQKLLTAVKAEKLLWSEKDEERKVALRDADAWRSKYERLLQSKRAEPGDLQACIRELDGCRNLEKRCYEIVGRAREGLDRIRIEYGDGKQTK